MEPMDPIRVLVADDHLFYREGMRTMLGTVPYIDVVGDAATGEQAVAQAAAAQPDVIVMDLKMPGVDGIEATRLIAQASPHIGVLVVTMFDDDSVFAAIRAGARGYLLKDADLEDVVRAIVAVSHGEAIFSPAIARRLMAYFAAPRPAGPPEAFPELTEREREVLTLLAQGQGNAATAARLGLSLKTVRNYVSNIFNKLQVSDRAHAIIRARDAGVG